MNWTQTQVEETEYEETEEEEVSENEETTVSIFDGCANIQLKGPVTPQTIDPIVEFIINLNLNSEIELNVINLFINTDGGNLASAYKLIEVMRMSDIPVRTIGLGSVASAGLLILMTGKERLISEYTSVMSHLATFNVANYSVRVSDSSHQKEFKNVLDRLFKTYTKSTGKDEKYIRKHLLKEIDVYLSAEECIKHGLVDKMLPDGMQWLKNFPLDN